MSQFSIADLLPSTSNMEIVHPAKGPMGIHLTVTGWDSIQFRKASKKVAQTRINKPDERLAVDDLEKDNAELAAACIVGWDAPEVFGEWSYAKSLEHMMNPGLTWLREQVEVYVRERAHFFRKDEPKPTESSGEEA